MELFSLGAKEREVMLQPFKEVEIIWYCGYRLSALSF
jgi:hypothetical protein